MSRPRAAGAVTTKCPRCGGQTVTQLVGANAALQVIADLTPLTAEQETAVRTNRNRLTWCYRTPKYGAPRLAWRDRWHPARCPHQHLADHACNGPPTQAVTPPQPASTLF